MLVLARSALILHPEYDEIETERIHVKKKKNNKQSIYFNAYCVHWPRSKDPPHFKLQMRAWLCAFETKQEQKKKKYYILDHCGAIVNNENTCNSNQNNNHTLPRLGHPPKPKAEMDTFSGQH